MDKPLLSIIIPNFNQSALLRRTLTSLASQTLPAPCFEVLVVDDGSSDDAEDLRGSLQVAYPLRWLHQDNRGASAARNLGAANATGDLLLFLDADMIADSNLVASHLSSHNSQERRLVAGRRRPWPPARGDSWPLSIDIDSNVSDVHPGGETISFSEVFSSNMSISMGDFREVGGFDEALPRWHDIDFSYRARKAGMRIVYNPEAIAYHNHPMSPAQSWRKARWTHCAAVLLLNKEPAIRSEIPYLQDKLPIKWQNDPPSLIFRKLARRALALQPALWLMESLFMVGLRSSQTQRFLYFKILGSYQLRGLREGIERYGW